MNQVAEDNQKSISVQEPTPHWKNQAGPTLTKLMDEIIGAQFPCIVCLVACAPSS